MQRICRVSLVVSLVLGALHAPANADDVTPPPQPTATAVPACAQPGYVPPRILRAVAPDVPALARQQGIGGTVVMTVALDERGNVVHVRMEQSPSVLLNQGSVEAAKRSTYAPAIRDCRPEPSTYRVTITYNL